MNTQDLIDDYKELKKQVNNKLTVGDNIEYELIEVEHVDTSLSNFEYIKVLFKDTKTGIEEHLQISEISNNYTYYSDRGYMSSSTKEGFATLIKNYLYGKHLEHKPKSIATFLFGNTPNWDDLLKEID